MSQPDPAPIVPSAGQHGATPSPEEAVRMELRAALHDIADALLDGQEPPVLLVTIRHTWILMDLATAVDSLAAHLLRTLAHELRARPMEVDRSHFANRLSSAADRL